MSKAWHCDQDDCDTWTYAGYRHGFIQVKEEKETVTHFCSFDCLMKYGSTRHPLARIDVT